MHMSMNLSNKNQFYISRFPCHVPSPWVFDSVRSRWYKNQIYINETKQVYLSYKVNGKGGTTMSVGHRGWTVLYQHARVLAGWDELPEETE